jgi:hypothetical protein
MKHNRIQTMRKDLTKIPRVAQQPKRPNKRRERQNSTARKPARLAGVSTQSLRAMMQQHLKL